MSFHLNIRSAALTTLLLSAFFAGCGSDTKPKPPQPGTPAFNWAAAKQAYQKGDYVKANTLLMQLSQGKSEFAEQARPLALMTSISMASSYMELSEKFAEGAKRTRGKAAPFMRSTGIYKSQATASSMQFLEEARRFIAANKDKDVTMPLGAPAAAEGDPPQYKKITSGQGVPESEIPGVEKMLITKNLSKNLTAAGVTTAGEATAPGPKFLLVVAKGLFNVSDMFGPKKLLQPNRLIEAAHEGALEALALVKDSKEARELEKKVKAAKKKLAASS
jgi:hypothetical protein